jgi:nicotinate-nucleotide adenylyltransferase
MRVGVFGGTFDPPHLGHLILAAEAADQLSLDRLLWVLTPDPPHKQTIPVTPAEIRLRLVEAAIADNPLFELSRIDLDRPGPQYSVDTIRLLKEQSPQSEYFFLMGGDSLHDLPTWRHAAEFIDQCAGIGVMRRPSDEVDLTDLFDLFPRLSTRLHFIDVPLLEISSSQIRQRVSAGKPYRYYLPPPVHELIRSLPLYQ